MPVERRGTLQKEIYYCQISVLDSFCFVILDNLGLSKFLIIFRGDPKDLLDFW